MSLSLDQLREAYVLLREIEQLQSTEAKAVLEKAILDHILSGQLPAQSSEIITVRPVIKRTKSVKQGSQLQRTKHLVETLGVPDGVTAADLIDFAEPAHRDNLSKNLSYLASRGEVRRMWSINRINREGNPQNMWVYFPVTEKAASTE